MENLIGEDPRHLVPGILPDRDARAIVSAVVDDSLSTYTPEWVTSGPRDFDRSGPATGATRTGRTRPVVALLAVRGRVRVLEGDPQLTAAWEVSVSR